MRESVDSTDETLIVDRSFDFVDDVVGQSGGFGLSAVGGGFVAEAIADGVDMLGGGFEEAVNGNAGFLVFNFGVFETVVEARFAAGGKDDAIYTDHFFGVVMTENDALTEFVLLQCDDFATR